MADSESKMRPEKPGDIKPGKNKTPATAKKPPQQGEKPVPETGGPRGPEPTRFGDWERNGRCSDF